MAHAVRPVISKVNQQKEQQPIHPRFFPRKECKVSIQHFVNTNGENTHKQPRYLRGNATAQVGNRVGQVVKLPVRKPFHHQFNPDQDEKDWNGQNDRVKIQPETISFATKVSEMALKILKGVWFFSMLALLVIFFYVYAGLPENVMLWDFPQQLALSRSGLFYVAIVLVALVNAMVYLVRQVAGTQTGLTSWFYGMIATVNIFLIAVLGFIHVFNGGERYDYSRMAPAIYGSIILVSVWLISWPVIKIFQKISAK